MLIRWIAKNLKYIIFFSSFIAYLNNSYAQKIVPNSEVKSTIYSSWNQIYSKELRTKKILWKISVIPNSKILLKDSMLYFVSKSDYLYKVNTSNGVIIWKSKANVYRTKNEISRKIKFFFTLKHIILNQSYNIRGFDLSNGKTLWKIGEFSEKPGDIFSNFVNLDGRINFVIYTWDNFFILYIQSPSVGPRPFSEDEYEIYDSRNGKILNHFRGFVIKFYKSLIISFNQNELKFFDIKDSVEKSIYKFILSKSANWDDRIYEEIRSNCNEAHYTNFTVKDNYLFVYLFDSCGEIELVVNLIDLTYEIRKTVN